jgi:hypothetical protein
VSEEYSTLIKTVDNKGIALTRNGITFSIQFGAGNYCQNRDNNAYTQYKDKPNTSSGDCEIAVFRGEEWITFLAFPEEGEHEEGSVDVVGYVPIEKALRRFLEFTEKHFGEE